MVSISLATGFVALCGLVAFALWLRQNHGLADKVEQLEAALQALSADIKTLQGVADGMGIEATNERLTGMQEHGAREERRLDGVQSAVCDLRDRVTALQLHAGLKPRKP